MKKLTITYLSAILLGALLTFAFAPFELFPLAVIVPGLLLVLWLDVSPRQAFYRGFAFGVGLFGVGVYWVYISMSRFGGVPVSFAFFITASLVAALALFPASVGYALNRYFPATDQAKLVCAFPAFWLFSEWIRSWFFGGFPWLLLGYSQTNSPLKGLAPILSVYGVSLALTLSAGLLVSAFLHFKQHQYRALYKNLLFFILIWLFSALFTLIPWTHPQGKPVTVSLVQGSIPQAIKWSADDIALSLKRYADLTNPRWGKSQLIIWPEAAVPALLQNVNGYINALDTKAKINHTTLILGIPIEIEKGAYYNAIVTLGNYRQVYLKRQLVPFGEYVPFTKTVSRLLHLLDIPMSDFRPGKLAQGPLVLGQLKILPAICYEIAFPELMRTMDKSINLILTLTNDAWFGKSAAQAQHLQMAAMRSIEMQRPGLIVGNDGISAIISSNGTIKKAAPPYEIFVLNDEVQPKIGLTPWMHNGIDPVLFIALLMLFFACYPLILMRLIRIKNKFISKSYNA